MAGSRQHKIFAAPIGAATPNTVYRQQAVKSEWHRRFNATFSHLLLSQLAATPNDRCGHSRRPAAIRRAATPFWRLRILRLPLLTLPAPSGDQARRNPFLEAAHTAPAAQTERWCDDDGDVMMYMCDDDMMMGLWVCLCVCDGDVMMMWWWWWCDDVHVWRWCDDDMYAGNVMTLWCDDDMYDRGDEERGREEEEEKEERRVGNQKTRTPTQRCGEKNRMEAGKNRGGRKKNCETGETVEAENIFFAAGKIHRGAKNFDPRRKKSATFVCFIHTIGSEPGRHGMVFLLSYSAVQILATFGQRRSSLPSLFKPNSLSQRSITTRC